MIITFLKMDVGGWGQDDGELLLMETAISAKLIREHELTALKRYEQTL